MSPTLYKTPKILVILITLISILSLTFAITLDSQSALLEQQSDSNRQLMQIGTHQFRIFTQVALQYNSNQINMQMFKKALDLATTFFRKTLTVTHNKLKPSETVPGLDSQPCSIISKYRFRGFDPSQYDCVIGVYFPQKQQQEQNQQTLVLATGRACAVARWAIYGQINIYPIFTIQENQNPFQFQQKIKILIHQIAHILVFSQEHFARFYVNYNSQQFIPKNQVVAPSPTDSSSKMIVTPTVKLNVQEVFGCNDKSIGGLLEQFGGTGTKNSHWDSKVFYDQLMLGTFTNAQTMSLMTLALFKDSGFFYDVDLTMGQKNFYGRGKGCDFALGKITPEDQFCQQPPINNRCGFYYQYSGYCEETGLKHENKSIKRVMSISEINCDYFSGFRCFQSILNQNIRQAACYQAHCSVSGESLTVIFQGKNITCEKNGNKKTNIQDEYERLICPDVQRFCSRHQCDNWCGYDALCIKGQCIAVDAVKQASTPSPGLAFLIIFAILYFLLLYKCWTTAKAPPALNANAPASHNVFNEAN